jgi:hypothetical protein
MKMHVLRRLFIVAILFLSSQVTQAGSCPFGEMEEGWCWPTEKGGWGSGFLEFNKSNSYFEKIGPHLGRDIAPGDGARIGSDNSGRRVAALADGVVLAVRDDICSYGGLVPPNDGTSCKYKRGAGIIIQHFALVNGSIKNVNVLYAHFNPLTSRWKVGDKIERGQEIGVLNDYTGGKIHLHLGASFDLPSNPWAGYGHESKFFDPAAFLKNNSSHTNQVEKEIQLRYSQGFRGAVGWEASYASCWNAPKVWLLDGESVFFWPVDKELACGSLNDFWMQGLLADSSKPQAALLERSKQGLLSRAREGVKDGLAYAANIAGLRKTAQGAGFSRDQYFEAATALSPAVVYKDGLLQVKGMGAVPLYTPHYEIGLNMLYMKVRRLLEDEIVSLRQLISTKDTTKTETTIQKVWLPEGEFPKITCSTGGRKRRSVYGFLNLKTGQEHAFKTECQNMHQTKGVLEEIRKIYP